MPIVVMPTVRYHGSMPYRKEDFKDAVETLDALSEETRKTFDSLYNRFCFPALEDTVQFRNAGEDIRSRIDEIQKMLLSYAYDCGALTWGDQ